LEQAVLFVKDVNDPTAQRKQLVADVMAEYWPAGHCLHCC